MRRHALVLALAVTAAGLLTGTGRARAAAHPHWIPPAHLTWDWQLQGRLRIEPVAVTDIDGLDASARTVAGLHGRGQHVICYIDVGTWENWRADARRFPRSVLGRPNGWPGERWLDIRRLSVLAPIIRARFSACARKHFDAVEPDNIDGFANRTGFHITRRQQLRYDEWVARTVHSMGMAVFEKNDPEQAAQLQPHFDGVVDEQCNQYSECAAFRPYLRAGKPVLDAEYRRSLYPHFCANDRRLGISGALFALSLNGSLFKPCG